MERAKQLWEDSSYQNSSRRSHGSVIISVYGPMRIKPKQGAVLGDHYETGEKRLQQCVPVKKLGGLSRFKPGPNAQRTESKPNSNLSWLTLHYRKLASRILLLFQIILPDVTRLESKHAPRFAESTQLQ